MVDINKIVGKNLLFLRKKAKLTQSELAEKFNYSDKSISKWETGESLPSIDILYQLSQFYGVTLDYLTKEEHKGNEETIVQTKPKAYPTKLVVTLLATLAVWVIATTLFVTLLLTSKQSYPIIFLWAIPASCVVLIVFNSIWGRTRWLFPILTGLVWTLLTSIHIQVLQAGINIWPIYLVGAPLQVGIILWDALLKSPHAYNKALREEKRKEHQKKKEELKKQIEELKK